MTNYFTTSVRNITSPRELKMAMCNSVLYGLLCLTYIVSASLYKNEQDYNEDNYEDDNETEPPEEHSNFYEDENKLRGTRPLHPFNQIHDIGTENILQDLLSLKRPIRVPGLKINRRKIIGRKAYKYLLPLLLSVLAKVAHFIPIVKLILLALFALVLFSKKAFLVSVGSLILVIYDTFYKHANKNINIVERGSTVPTVEHVSSPDDPTNLEEGWWAREEMGSKLGHQLNHNNEKWNKWWAPQINLRKTVDKPRSRINRRNQDNLILRNIEHLFQTTKK